MKHLVFFSGGAGSYASVKRLIAQGVSSENIHLLFTDTCIEDIELYRFMMDAFELLYSSDLSFEKQMVSKLVGTEVNLEIRKKQLLKIQDSVNSKIPNIHWIRYEINGVGLSPWDIFNNDLFIGNNRVANCSSVIKQRLAKEYVARNFEPKNTYIYLGIDWSEDHRAVAPKLNWKDYCIEVLFPMCEEPYLFKDDIVKIIAEDGIKIPEPYLKGQAHLNCGGFCVRGGQAHFAKLLNDNPKLYEFHANKERVLRTKIQHKNCNDLDYSILKQTRSGVVYNLTLDKLRDQLKLNSNDVDMNEYGGCGCFVLDAEIDNHAKWNSKNLKVVKFEKDSNPITYKTGSLF